jgi:hypothetical protein
MAPRLLTCLLKPESVSPSFLVGDRVPPRERVAESVGPHVNKLTRQPVCDQANSRFASSNHQFLPSGPPFWTYVVPC